MPTRNRRSLWACQQTRLCVFVQRLGAAQPRRMTYVQLGKDGRVPFAGAVLRLGGAHLGGYGESDIAYAYRQARWL